MVLGFLTLSFSFQIAGILLAFIISSLVASVASTRQQLQKMYMREGFSNPLPGIVESIKAFFMNLYNMIFGAKNEKSAPAAPPSA